MKRTFVAAAIAAMLVGIFSGGVAIGKSDSQRFGKIECESIVVKSPDGRYSVQVAGFKGGAGIWIEDSKTKRMTTIYNTDKEGPVVAIHDGKSLKNGWTAALAIGGSIISSDHAYFQDAGGGMIRQVPLNKIVTK